MNEIPVENRVSIDMQTLFKTDKRIYRHYNPKENIVLHLGDALEFLKTLPTTSSR